MNTIICPNPSCGKPHGIFYLVKPNGRRILSYRCDRVAKQSKDPYVPNANVELHYTKAIFPVPDRAFVNTKDLGKNAPEEWSAGYRKAQQDKAQGVLL